MATLHPLIVQAQKSLPSKTPAREKDFVAKFFANASGEDLETMDVITLQRTARHHWDMMHARKKNKAQIRVHSPSLTKGGWPLNRTIIDFVDDDMAFQIDSITAELTRRGYVVHLMIHPVLYVARDKSGAITDIFGENKEGASAQSHIHIELNRTLPLSECEALQKSLQQIIADVRHATRDWLAMREKLRLCEADLSNAPANFADDEIEEYQAFLEYLYKDNFTLLGYRQYKYAKDKSGKLTAKTVADSPLGLLRPEVETDIMPEGVDALPAGLMVSAKNRNPLRVFKLHRRSTVHRSVPMDAILVRHYNKKGEPSGESVFVGLFTSVTYSRSIRDIPYLSRKTAMVMDRARFTSGTHGFKALSHILEKYPRDELFQIDAPAGTPENRPVYAG
jgi:glutamate dehydrogenase